MLLDEVWILAVDPPEGMGGVPPSPPIHMHVGGTAKHCAMRVPLATDMLNYVYCCALYHTAVTHLSTVHSKTRLRDAQSRLQLYVFTGLAGVRYSDS